MERLILWDIDGTLLSAGSVGARVFDEAFQQVVGVVPTERVHMSGKTDPQIVGEYLELYGVDASGDHLGAIIAELERGLAAAEDEIRSHGVVLPGVREALTALGDDPSVLQSILTGNIAPNAYVKLAALGLEQLVDLDVGAYGSDHADRRQLVPLARNRVATMRGETFADDAVWVVGDSPNDLACARAGGVRCMLVATGRFGYGELAALKPDAVLESLAETAVVLDILGP